MVTDKGRAADTGLEARRSSGLLLILSVCSPLRITRRTLWTESANKFLINLINAIFVRGNSLVHMKHDYSPAWTFLPYTVNLSATHILTSWLKILSEWDSILPPIFSPWNALCRPDCLKLRDLPASASQALELKAFATIPQLWFHLLTQCLCSYKFQQERHVCSE